MANTVTRHTRYQDTAPSAGVAPVYYGHSVATIGLRHHENGHAPTARARPALRRCMVASEITDGTWHGSR